MVNRPRILDPLLSRHEESFSENYRPNNINFKCLTPCEVPNNANQIILEELREGENKSPSGSHYVRKNDGNPPFHKIGSPKGREQILHLFHLPNVELSHGVSDAGANGIVASDWIWISECPVSSNPASASFKSVCFEPRIAQMGTDCFVRKGSPR
jgi:hypothetical protein